MDMMEMLKSFPTAQVYLIAVTFAVARMSGMVFVMPAFQRLGLTGVLKGTVALVFALPMVPAVLAAISHEPLTITQIMVLVLKEFMVGVVIGFVLGIPIWAAEVAGDVLDLQRGSSFASIMDPAAGTESTVLSTLLALTIVAMYFAMGGLTLTLKTVYGSYGLWPMNDMLPMFSSDAGKLLLGLADQVMRMGLMLVVPLVMALLLTDIALALVARAAQHLHVFDLSLSVKNLVLGVLFVLYAAFLFNYMKTDLGWMVDGNARLEALSPAGNKP